MPTKKEISNLLFAELANPMKELGFTGKKSDFSFRKSENGWEYVIIGDILMYEAPLAEFHFVVTCEEIEKILAAALPKRRKKEGYEPTFNFPHTIFYPSPKQREDFLIEADDYFGIVAQSFLDLFNEKINPVMEAARDFAQLDQLANKVPFQYQPVFWHETNHTLKGLIVRYLVNPAGLDEIIEMYRQVAKSFSKGNLNELNALYEYLKSIQSK